MPGTLVGKGIVLALSVNQTPECSEQNRTMVQSNWLHHFASWVEDQPHSEGGEVEVWRPVREK
jgi:hypothetical protein